MPSLLFYHFIMFLCVFLCHRAVICHNNKLKIFSYLIIAFISIIRFDIGSDYEAYWYTFDYFSHVSFKSLTYANLSINFAIQEPFTFLLILLFSPFQEGPLWIFGMYSCLTLLFIYKTIEFWCPKQHALCIFILFVSYILFETWDWVRQGLAMSLILYSSTFLHQNKKKKFLICYIAAICCHLSSIVFGFCFFINKIKIKRNVLLIVIAVAYILGISGFFGNLFGTILSWLPIYEYALTDRFVDSSNTNFQSLGFLTLAVWYGALCYYVYKENTLIGNLIFIGAFLSMVSGNNLLISRIAWYFTSFQLIAVSLVLNREKNNSIGKIIMIFLICLMFIRYNRNLLDDAGIRGCTPYETIFSDEYQRKHFRIRGYRLNNP